MKLEVGMYVRTERGYIAKCTYIDKEIEGIYGFDGAIRKSFGDEYDFIYTQEHDITKASHNIIDLIEVGDYDNGLIVNDVVTDIDGTKTFNLFKQLSYFGNEDIKTIVTKEQFESMKYSLEG